METEIRYYFNEKHYQKLLEQLKNNEKLKYKGCFYELTIQYDHPLKEMSFYSKDIDGRFRVRCSKDVSNDEASCKISWKKRLKETTKGLVNKEEEIEVDFNYNQLDNLIFLLENVIHMKKVESYERYRNIFANDNTEIVVDKYPFGIALEIENKGDEKNAENNIVSWAKCLNLDLKNAYRLSWDDKYSSLCREQNIQIYKDVKFGLPMPKVGGDVL